MAYNAQQDSCLYETYPSPLLSLLAVCPALLLPAAALAEKADRTKPMNIEADALRYDDLKQTSVFTGKVVSPRAPSSSAAPGSTCARTPRATSTASSRPRPASWRSTGKSANGVDEYIEGEGERIEYDGRADNVKFIRRAVMRRYRRRHAGRRDHRQR